MQYADVTCVIRKTAPRSGHTVSGYGGKLPTEYMVQLRNDNKFRRVYAICYSNCASFYVFVKREAVYIHDWDLK